MCIYASTILSQMNALASEIRVRPSSLAGASVKIVFCAVRYENGPSEVNLLTTSSLLGPSLARIVRVCARIKERTGLKDRVPGFRSECRRRRPACARCNQTRGELAQHQPCPQRAHSAPTKTREERWLPVERSPIATTIVNTERNASWSLQKSIKLRNLCYAATGSPLWGRFD